MPNIVFEKIHPGAIIPTYAHEGDSGFDLYACEPFTLSHGQLVKVPLGIKATIEPGWEVQVRPRSSVGCKKIIIPNSPGTIDSGYRGAWLVPLMLLSRGRKPANLAFPAGARIAQGVIAPVYRATISEGKVDPKTDRGEGGFGSTGG